MPKHYSYGPVWKDRVLHFVEALLQYANQELDGCPWKDLACTWQSEDTSEPKLVVRTKLRVLENLSSQIYGNERLTKSQIRDILNHYLSADFLDILEDHREKPQGSDSWHFSLTLKFRDWADNQQWINQRWEDERNERVKSPQAKTVKPEAIRPKRILKPGAPLQTQPLPDHFVERPEHQNAVKAQLLDKDTKIGMLVVSAIYGLGGIGKSVLAAKLTHDTEVQTRFLDGILWATLGQNPDILPLLSGWIQALGDYDYKPTAVESASNHLRTLLYDKQALLVVDDIWNPAHLDPFRVGGESCCVLVTTREARIPNVHRYDLDVMTADQALELMSHKLSGGLQDFEQQKALAFAERVGYLPLALELATSQINEGVNWQELFEDFQAEVTRLEVLDVYSQAEMPDDAKRRKYSLLACFNLSLKQLSPGQLQQFAWLGVVPEDVNLTAEMAETLWQVSSRQARAILRTFRVKALVLQGATLVDEQPNYRMHDLIHNLAQRLLTSPTQPIQVNELQGLGLTKANAHSELLKRYRVKTQDRLWHTVKDDGYIHAHLTWHMEQAQQPQAIHRLLQTSNIQGRNGWYEACDAIGKPVVFINDVSRAWQLAINNYERTPCESVALLFRYTLIRTSLNSLASTVPAELVGALVKNRIWQPAQGLAHAQQRQDQWQRAKCISAIVPYVSEALLPEVLQTINQINEAIYRSYVLSKLAEHFPEIWPEVLTTIHQIQDHYGHHGTLDPPEGFISRAYALSELATMLPSQYFAEAIEITRKIQNDHEQSWVLETLAQYIPAELWPDALEVARKIQDNFCRSRVLIALAQYIPAELWPDVLEEARKIQDNFHRSRALIALAQHLPELYCEALGAIHKIRNDVYRTSALIMLAQHLPELCPEAIETTHQIQNDRDLFSILQWTCKYLPDAIWPEALELAHKIQDEWLRWQALCELAEYLPETLWPEIIKLIRQIQDEKSRSHALNGLAEHLPESVWPEALELTCQLQDEHERSWALIGVVKYLPESLCLEALEPSRQIQGEWFRSLALCEIARHLPDLWPEALGCISQIQHEGTRWDVLSEIAEYLPASPLCEALELTHQIQDYASQLSVMSEMAEYLPELWPKVLKLTCKLRRGGQSYSDALHKMALRLPEALWPEVLELIYQLKDEEFRSDFLCEIVEYLPRALWPEALTLIHQRQDEISRTFALCTLAKHLPDLCTEALENICQIECEAVRVNALAKIAPYLPEALWPKALKIIYQIQDNWHRSRNLGAIASHLPKSLWPKLLEFVCQLQSERERSIALSNIALHLPEPLWPKALGLTQQLPDENRLRVLGMLVRHLPDLWPEVLELIRQTNEKDRSFTLREMTPHLPESLWPEALELTRQIQCESDRQLILYEIARYLPKTLFSEALKLIQQFQDELYRSYLLSETAKYLPEALWPEVLDITWAIKDKNYRAIALQEFLNCHFNRQSMSFTDWVELLDILACQNRYRLLDALPKMRPIIIQLADIETVSETLQAVREVCRQWS